MGTRSITVVKDSKGNKIIEMYKQFDGYPEGLGKDLKDFISSGTLVNGISLGYEGIVFNGIEDFAAQLIKYLKEGPGGIYLYSPTPDYSDKKKYSDQYHAEYYYEISSDLTLKCWDTYEDKQVEIPL